jgi:hypothetical protein
MASGFACVPESEWLLSARINHDSRQKLLENITFEAIVDRIATTAELTYHKRARARDVAQAYYRVAVTLGVDAETVSLFHNSRCGYRAQYYTSRAIGERANRYAIVQIIPRLKSLLDGKAKRTCPWNWTERSLLDPHAKVWIHQGKWAYYQRIKDRNVCVERWKAGLRHESCCKRNKAVLGSLCPLDETGIDLLGGFIDIGGNSLGRGLKLCRGQDIRDFGFT